ncbi:MAG TPA: hypothetical protein VKR06_19820 [Ktedonosporobacter sp.]|nr:hypothetical protein [Ktedonosporobacter sp.]
MNFKKIKRIRIEIMNYQARTALAMKDLDAFCCLLEQGVQAAIRLGSEKRKQEAMEIYQDALLIWPHEARVRQLTGLFALAPL